MGNAKLPKGPAGRALTRRYLELMRAWRETRPQGPELRDLGVAEARRFQRALPPGEGIGSLVAVARLAMLDRKFPIHWARHWLRSARRG
jgi:hypothetical protein